jgi:anti-sigma factor RsiW
MAMTTDRKDQIDAIEDLLPWYAAGTLDPLDARRVEEELARRPELRASLDLVREDRDETIALNEALGAPGGAAWLRVLAAVRAEPRKPTLKARLMSLAGLVGLGAEPQPRRLAWAGAAAAIVIALQATAILSLLPAAKGPGYHVASEAGAPAGGASVLVAFAPDARLDQVGAWLQQHHASIVEGPRGGLYRLRVGDKSLTRDETAALAAELAATPLVRMALPATGE